MSQTSISDTYYSPSAGLSIYLLYFKKIVRSKKIALITPIGRCTISLHPPISVRLRSLIVADYDVTAPYRKSVRRHSSGVSATYAHFKNQRYEALWREIDFLWINFLYCLASHPAKRFSVYFLLFSYFLLNIKYVNVYGNECFLLLNLLLHAKTR